MLPRSVLTTTTVANGATVTAAVRVPDGMVLTGIVWPSALTNNQFTLQNASNGSTYTNVIGVVQLTPTVSTQYPLSRLVTEGCDLVKILMSGVGNEAAERTIGLVFSPR
jgi:hypothetical protein